MKQFWIALKIFLVLTIITGIIYPLVVTGIAYLFFPSKAQGSMVRVRGKNTGSALIGQKFMDSCYFWGRPSAVDYNTLPSGGSNLGPISVQLKTQIEYLRDSLAVRNGKSATEVEVPSDLLFASGSGLDPHISPQAAFFQLDRVTEARGLDSIGKLKLQALVISRVEAPTMNFLGEPRVNVLLLNLAVDSTFGEVNP
jgi:potassium-transporting ATPase KdpC subunit